jgi:hypothetical protein
MEDNQNSRGTRRANTSGCKLEYAVRVPLRFKTAVKAISKGKNQNTKEERFSHRSKHSLS